MDISYLTIFRMLAAFVILVCFCPFQWSQMIEEQKLAPFNLARISRPPITWNGISETSYYYKYYRKQRTNKLVDVYILDSGVDATHVDFQGGNQVKSLGSFVVGEPDFDLSGHGTHIAGVIGSKTYGVCKDGINIYSIKVLNKRLQTSWSTIDKALRLVIDRVNGTKSFGRRPSIINLSVSGNTYDARVDESLHRLKMLQVPVVVAAGNGNTDACTVFPAKIPHVISVGAISAFDEILDSPASNYGPCVDIYAPGQWIRSTFPGNTTKSLSGTSMAAPHVTGILAGWLASYKNPVNVTLSDLEIRLKKWHKKSEIPIAFNDFISYMDFGQQQQLEQRIRQLQDEVNQLKIQNGRLQDREAEWRQVSEQLEHELAFRADVILLTNQIRRQLERVDSFFQEATSNSKTKSNNNDNRKDNNYTNSNSNSNSNSNNLNHSNFGGLVSSSMIKKMISSQEIHVHSSDEKMIIYEQQPLKGYLLETSLPSKASDEDIITELRICADYLGQLVQSDLVLRKSLASSWKEDKGSDMILASSTNHHPKEQSWKLEKSMLQTELQQTRNQLQQLSSIFLENNGNIGGENTFIRNSISNHTAINNSIHVGGTNDAVQIILEDLKSTQKSISATLINTRIPLLQHELEKLEKQVERILYCKNEALTLD